MEMSQFAMFMVRYRIRGLFHWDDFITVNRIRYISEVDIHKKQFILLVFAENCFQRLWLPMCNELALSGNCLFSTANTVASLFYC